MKNLYLKKTKAVLQLFMLTITPFAVKANAQCPTGVLFLDTQTAVNSFATSYPNCTTISGNLTIGAGISSTTASDITDVSPLANITQVNGNVFIQNNALLQNLDGLNISNITGRLYIGGDNAANTNSQLQNINGLSSLTNIGQFMQILRNPLLTQVNGLSNLTTVGLDIEIDGNTALSDISGLQNTTFNPNDGYGLTIKNNPALAVCKLSNFCTYLANPASTHPREIFGNLANCLDEAAVLAACATMSVEDIDRMNIKVYPNPVKDLFTVSYNAEITNVSIINMLGQTILTKNTSANNVQLDISSLPLGNYFVKVTSEGMMKIVKIIKQ